MFSYNTLWNRVFEPDFKYLILENSSVGGIRDHLSGIQVQIETKLLVCVALTQFLEYVHIIELYKYD